ncbi:hypothetical protein UlMin_027999 [Ulmus minor]
MSSGEHQITMPGFDQQKDKVMFGKLQDKMQEGNEISSNGQGQGRSQVPKIQRIPKVMKDENHRYWEKYFKPSVIAIGPIHADSKNLSEGEGLKLMWAAKYMDGLNKEKILDDIRCEIESLMGCFDEKCLDKDAIAASRDEYVYGTVARMLFVDGCAMLQFIYSFVWDDFMKNLKINAAQATLVQQDLFLLENQIPFRVLQIIMDGGKNKQQTEREEEIKKIESDYEKLKKMGKAVQMFNSDYDKPEKMETAVQMFIHLSNMSTASRPEISLKSFDGVVHLLDLLRRSVLLDDRYSAPSDDCCNWAFNCLFSFVKFSVSVIFKLPLYVLCFLVCLACIIVFIFYDIICNFIDFLKNGASYCRKYLEIFCSLPTLFMIIVGLASLKSPIARRSFRNVQELKTAGIKLKPSKGRCLKEVSFSSGLLGGCLRLCPILVDKSTAGKLLNLIAYEMCPDYHCKTTEDSEMYDYRISSYVSFLDSLIDNEQDVKDLRAAHILRHRLSSDADVAELFNKISPISVADDAYGNVISEIQEYYEGTIRIWITEFRREHLSSPWTLLALVAAAAALGLTAAQTYFAINPK